MREAFQGGADPATIEGFYDHRAKIAAAGKQVSPEYLKLSAGAFQADASQADAFDTGTPADFATRLAGLYVDWKDDEWQYGAKVDPAALKESITAVSAVVAKACAWWT